MTSAELHRVLAIFYGYWRHQDAPVDSWTERMWVEIEKAEAEEGVRG